MTRAALLLCCLLFAACAQPAYPPWSSQPDPSPPPEPVWQEGPDGWVYGRSPLHLWPAGFDNREITRLPDRIIFRAGEARLDRNGRQIVLLQSQLMRQLPNHDITLFCGWSSSEAERLGTEQARDLAESRCEEVMAVYRAQGVALRTLHGRLVRPVVTEAEEGQRSVRITVVPTAAGRPILKRVPLWEDLDVPLPRNPLLGKRPSKYGYGRYENEHWLYLPEVVYFDWGSADLDANARSILQTVSDWVYPGSDFSLFLNCDQVDGERLYDEAEKGLARDRCEAVRDFLVSNGVCESCIVHGPGGRHRHARSKHGIEDDDNALGAWMDLY